MQDFWGGGARSTILVLKKQSKTEIKGGGWWISTQTVAHFLGEGGLHLNPIPNIKANLFYAIVS